MKPLSRRAFLAAAASGVLAGCAGGRGGSKALAWGTVGSRNGQFHSPRAIGVRDGEIYVIDRTGRMQIFNEEGEYRRGWHMPEAENGTPTGIGFDEGGRVLVPDTHYSRLLEYSTKGELLARWGTYGNGPGEFIYPTDVSRDSNGFYYFSEYGMDAERVHVFDPERRFARQWGRHGEAEGEFGRAMALVIGGDDIVYVCDTTNHRIQCFDPSGRFLRVIGEPGTSRGQMKYPYDIALAPDGTIFACEYGNHRISRFSDDGRFIACFGTPGRRLGEFNGPRGIAILAEEWIFIADTDNHRIQRLAMGDLS